MIHVNGKAKPRHIHFICISGVVFFFFFLNALQHFERGEKARSTYPDNSSMWFIVWVLQHCRRLKIIILLQVVIYLIMSQAPMILLRCWAGPEAVSSEVTVPKFLTHWDVTCGSVTWLLPQQKLNIIILFLKWAPWSHHKRQDKSKIWAES